MKTSIIQFIDTQISEAAALKTALADSPYSLALALAYLRGYTYGYCQNHPEFDGGAAKYYCENFLRAAE